MTEAPENTTSDIAPRSGRGGKRPGAGRKKKGTIRAPKVAGIDLEAAIRAEPPKEIDAVTAEQDTAPSLSGLVKLLLYGTSEPAQITAAKEVLDRGYGKPAVEIGGDAAMLPFMAVPDSTISLSSQLRTEAKRYANLALEVLRKIRDHGSSETARAAACKALLERAHGTVGKARMPDEQRERPLGKKEEAARAAETAATGRYATPPAPRSVKNPETVQ